MPKLFAKFMYVVAKYERNDANDANSDSAKECESTPQAPIHSSFGPRPQNIRQTASNLFIFVQICPPLI
ncbi:hypothetical protein VN97_g10327 [Penicillium thymicola]|uniref:Uncharacterized protein n=1 Tax=Penicillium thymicola TaxID=293382 RepID=A0AAI9T9K1_PENTH|nr:hypothetical protein VN97_g10327 [Penicillium thymicola]